MKLLCDICRKEYDGKEEDMDSLSEQRCPDCKEDLSLWNLQPFSTSLSPSASLSFGRLFILEANIWCEKKWTKNNYKNSWKASFIRIFIFAILFYIVYLLDFIWDRRINFFTFGCRWRRSVFKAPKIKKRGVECATLGTIVITTTFHLRHLSLITLIWVITII